MIKNKLVTLVFTMFFAMGAAMMGVNAQAEDVPQDAFDEAQYGVRMQTLLSELQKAHDVAKDPERSQGDVAKAKQKAFKTAGEMLKIIDKRLHSLDIKQGAQLSPTEMLINTHVMVVMLDLLVGETLPHKDEWNYAY
jgi:hypothetical protein